MGGNAKWKYENMKRSITVTCIGWSIFGFRYYYLCTIDSLKNDLLGVLLTELSFSGLVKLAVSFAYQESLACVSDEIPARDEY